MEAGNDRPTSQSPSPVTESSRPRITVQLLHWELLQKIFGNLDGRNLVMCKRVCTSWRDHITYLEQKRTFWYDNCQKEIPAWAQFDILDNIYPSHWKNQTIVNWEVIYRCWDASNVLKDESKTHAVTKCPARFKEISSIKVSGNWLLISTYHASGQLTAYSFQGEILEVYVGTNAIIEFELVNTGKKYKPNVNESGKLKKLFDTLDHNEIWVELKGLYVQLGRNYCYKIDNYQQKIRHSYGYKVQLTRARSNSLINLMKICDSLNGPEVMEVEMPRHYTNILDFWSDKISLTYSDTVSSGAVKVDTWTINKKTQSVSNGVNVNHMTNGRSKFYSWQNSLFSVYSDKWRLSFNVENGSVTNETSARKGDVTAVFFYVGYLFLGTDRGELLVYCMKDPNDCLNVVAHKDVSRIFKICCDKIAYISVAEPKQHGGVYTKIICATSEDVYFLSFL